MLTLYMYPGQATYNVQRAIKTRLCQEECCGGSATLYLKTSFLSKDLPTYGGWLTMIILW